MGSKRKESTPQDWSPVASLSDSGSSAPIFAPISGPISGLNHRHLSPEHARPKVKRWWRVRKLRLAR